MQTSLKSEENQSTEQPGQTEFDIAAKRSRDYTDAVIGHVFERIGKEHKASVVSEILSFVLPSMFSSSPASVAKRYYRRHTHKQE